MIIVTDTDTAGCFAVVEISADLTATIRPKNGAGSWPTKWEAAAAVQEWLRANGLVDLVADHGITPARVMGLMAEKRVIEPGTGVGTARKELVKLCARVTGEVHPHASAAVLSCGPELIDYLRSLPDPGEDPF